MARALKCDICGGFFEYDPDIPNTIEYYHRNINGGYSGSKKVDCCPVCFGGIVKVIYERSKLKEEKDVTADN